MLRALARVLLWLVIVAGALSVLALLLVAVEPGEERGTAVVLGLVILGICVAAWFGERALRRSSGEDRRSATREAVGGMTAQEASDDDVITLPPTRRKWMAVSLICGVSALALLVMMLAAPHVFLVAAFVFFAGFTVVGVRSLVPGAVYLKIGRQGLVAKEALRTTRHSWDEIDHFQVYEVHTQYSTQRLVGFELSDRAREERSLWQRMSRGISGVDVGLPDTYGHDPDELAELLQSYRDRYGTVRDPRPAE